MVVVVVKVVAVVIVVKVVAVVIVVIVVKVVTIILLLVEVGFSCKQIYIVLYRTREFLNCVRITGSLTSLVGPIGKTCDT